MTAASAISRNNAYIPRIVIASIFSVVSTVFSFHEKSTIHCIVLDYSVLLPLLPSPFLRFLEGFNDLFRCAFNTAVMGFKIWFANVHCLLDFFRITTYFHYRFCLLFMV